MLCWMKNECGKAKNMVAFEGKVGYMYVTLSDWIGVFLWLKDFHMGNGK